MIDAAARSRSSISVSVDPECHGRVGVTQPAGNSTDINPSTDELGRREVSKVMEAHVLQPQRVPHPDEETGHIVWPERLAAIEIGREHVSIGRDSRPRLLSSRLDISARCWRRSRTPTSSSATCPEPVRLGGLLRQPAD